MTTTHSRCAHFPQCGGCSSQDISYSQQLEDKETILKEIYGPLSDRLLPAIVAKSSWAYRNKMEFSFSQDKAGNHYLGLFLKRRRVLDLYECHLTPPWFVEAMSRTRQWWKASGLQAFHPHKNTGSLRTLILREGRRTGEKLVLLTVSGAPEYALTKQQIEDFVETLTPIDPTISIFIRIQMAVKGRPTQFFEHNVHGPDHITERLTIGTRELTFKVSPSSFFQPNTEQAEAIYNQAVHLLPLSPDDTLYDLYCGTGSLGMACAPHVKNVIGIELSPYAVFDAQANCALNNITNMEIHKGDVAELLPTLKNDHPPAAAIVDPPRPGLGPSAIENLLALAPKHLLYISCNPKTHAPDLEALSSAYEVLTLQPVDQFPHTPHIEVLALLQHR